MFDDIGVGITFVMKNIKETQGQISDLQKSLDGLEKTKVGSPLKEASKNTSEFTKGIKDAVGNIKKMAFALLTIRGVWFAVRKAMTTYLSQNEELQNKLNAVFYGVGSLFAPLLETLLNVLGKILLVIDTVAKAIGLAGINMKNFGKSTSSASKEVNKLLKIDEINNLNDSSGGFDSFGNAMKWLDDLELSDKLKNFATSLGLTIKDVFIDWDINAENLMEKLNVGMLALAGLCIGGVPGAFVGATLGLLLNSVLFNHNGILEKNELLGSVTGIAAALGAIGLKIGGMAGLVASSLGVVLVLSLLSANMENMDFGAKKLLSVISGLLTAAFGTATLVSALTGNYVLAAIFLGLTITTGVVSVNSANATADNETEILKQAIGNAYENGKISLKDKEMDIEIASKVNVDPVSKEEAKKVFEDLGMEMNGYYKNAFEDTLNADGSYILSAMAQSIYEDEDGKENIKTNLISPLTEAGEELGTTASNIGVETVSFLSDGVLSKQEEIKNAWNSIKDDVLLAWGQMENGVKISANNIITSIETIINSAVQGFNHLARELESINEEQKEMMGLNFAIDYMSQVSLPRLATGTNYVPRDMIAEIHQGEAVVPKEFNPNAFYGTNTAEELNLLASINEQLVELNRKDTTINLDGENMARTINNKIQQIQRRNGVNVFDIQR